MSSTTALTTLTGHRHYRWIVLGLCWFSFTMTSVDRSTWGPAATFVGEDLGVPLASLGVFATAYYVGYVVSNVLGGFSSDTLGGRRVLAFSLVGAGAFMMIFGSTTSAALGITVQAVVGLFAGADYSAGIKLIASWFEPRQLGLAMGVFTSATSLGTVIANAAVPAIISASGWGTSYHVFGAVSILSGLMCYVVLRPGPVVVSAADAEDAGGRLQEMRALLSNRDLMLVALAGFGGFWGTYGFITWSNALMTRGQDISPGTAGAIVAVFAGVAVLGKPLIGLIADRFNGARKVPSVAILALFVIMLLVFGMLSTPLQFFIAAPLLGLAAYGYLPLLVALIPRLVDSRMTGSAAGLTNGFWQLGSVLVPLAIGGVYSATGSFLAAFGTLAVGPLLGALIMLMVNERRPVVTSIDPALQHDGTAAQARSSARGSRTS